MNEAIPGFKPSGEVLSLPAPAVDAVIGEHRRIDDDRCGHQSVRAGAIVPLMTAAVGELGDVELAEIEAAVGSASFKRGRGYAHGNRVLEIKWNPEEEMLSGSVIGHGAIYSTAAVFAGDDGELTSRRGNAAARSATTASTWRRS